MQLENFNLILIEKLSEAELQTLYEDPRYYFPEDKVYKHIDIFERINAFINEHLNIKENYLLKVKDNEIFPAVKDQLELLNKTRT